MKTVFLGDVHLGKRFQHGVPLHRRGDREAMQWADFEASLNTPCDLHVQVGDLFDSFYVPFSVVYRAARLYREAAKTKTCVLLRGNHDASRDADKVSAFQIFTEMVRPHGVIVADEVPVGFDDYCFIPWHPFKTAIEMLPGDMTGVTAVGHWDVVMGDTNQIPAAEMKARGAVAAITGHDHHARQIEIDGLPVTITGSMQPYSHSEDPEGRIYVTRTLSDLDDVKDKAVRLVLEPGEELREPIDCLQLQITRNRDEVELESVEFEAFDFRELYDEAVRQVEIGETMAALVYDKVEEARAARA